MTLDANTKQIFQTLVNQARCVVVKVGSSLITQNNNSISRAYLQTLGELIQTLIQIDKKKVILVTSGAAASGRSHVPAQQNTLSLVKKQALASIGQVTLMESYRRAFSNHNILISQILLSKFSINHRASYLNARNTIQALWEIPALPIINENDPLATEEIKLGDNDVLGALICGLADADLYIMLSDTPGFSLNYKSTQADFLKIIPTVTATHIQAAKGPGSHIGTGGMITKLEAVKVNEKFNIPTLITSGKSKNLYENIFHQHSGTLFLGQTTQQPIKRPSSKKRWLFSNISTKGKLTVDAGAALALLHNKSLLPKGIVSVTGTFHAGDVCSILSVQPDTPSNSKLIGRGLSNYNSTELKKICGANSKEIKNRLGYKGHDEVIHKNNLVLL